MMGWLWRGFVGVAFSFARQRGPRAGRRRHVGQLLVRALFAVRYQDVACPYRLLRREVFTHLPIQSDGPLRMSRSWPRPISSATSWARKYPSPSPPTTPAISPGTRHGTGSRRRTASSLPLEFGSGPTGTEQALWLLVNRGRTVPACPKRASWTRRRQVGNDAGEHYPGTDGASEEVLTRKGVPLCCALGSVLDCCASGWRGSVFMHWHGPRDDQRGGRRLAEVDAHLSVQPIRVDLLVIDVDAQCCASTRTPRRAAAHRRVVGLDLLDAHLLSLGSPQQDHAGRERLAQGPLRG